MKGRKGKGWERNNGGKEKRNKEKEFKKDGTGSGMKITIQE